mmetsp:Transcript_98668/g.170819  ORF Transcript_98668/g.170819 Transcript_98668/m.170819 type:complete len:317 (-) Transcript_98668:20-970(-)
MASESDAAGCLARGRAAKCASERECGKLAASVMAVSLQRWQALPDKAVLHVVKDFVVAITRSRLLGQQLAWLANRRRVVKALLAAGTVGVVGIACSLAHSTRQWSRLRALNILDPTFGPGIVHDMLSPDELHEGFLDSVHIQRGSSIREHLSRLFKRGDMTEQLCKLFEQATNGGDRLTRDDFTRLSRGIRGHLRVLLSTRERVNLSTVTPEDQRWIATQFDHFFPPERPLDRRIFPGYFKLILMRRIVRTLVARIGLQKLRQGISAPLVLVVEVDLNQGHPPFRINTVTPNSNPGGSGVSLCSIEEAPSPKERRA